LRSLAAVITLRHELSRLVESRTLHGVGSSDQTNREWEKSIARDRAAFERKPGFFRFPIAIRDASIRDIWPAPTPSVRSALE